MKCVLGRSERMPDLLRQSIQRLPRRPCAVGRAEAEAETVANVAWDDVQVHVKNILPRGFAISHKKVDAFASDAALAQRRGDLLRDTEHLAAGLGEQVRQMVA